MKNLAPSQPNALHKKMRGYTLIEVLLVFGIIAVAVVAIIGFSNSAANSGRTNEVITQLQSYTAGTKNLYASQPTYGTADITSTIITAGLAPANAVSGTTLVNPWGFSTRVVGNGSSFHVYFEAVPQDACVRILTAGLLSQGGVTNIWTVTGTTTGAPTTAVTVPAVGPRSFDVDNEPTPATAAAACVDTNNNIYMAVR